MVKKEIKQQKIDRLSLKVGDTITVYQKGQAAFTGVVIKKHAGLSPSATFTVWAILSGVGVEKIYPLHSPLITKIERIKSAQVRRAKLYYLREKVGKKAELKEKTTKPKAPAQKTRRVKAKK